MLAKPLTCDRSSSLLQLEKPKSPTSEQVKGPSIVGSWDSNSQDSCIPGLAASQHQFASLGAGSLALRNHSGELLSPFYSWENKAPNLSCLGSSMEDHSFRSPHSRGARSGPSPPLMVNGPSESSKTWVPWILKATLENLDHMVYVVTINLGHFTTPTHPRKPSDS